MLSRPQHAEPLANATESTQNQTHALAALYGEFGTVCVRSRMMSYLSSPRSPVLDQHGDDVQHAVHIDAGHATVQGRKSLHQDARHRLHGHGAGSATVGVRDSSVEVRSGTGVGPSFVLRPHRARVPPHMVHRARAFMLGASRATHGWLGGTGSPASAQEYHLGMGITTGTVVAGKVHLEGVALPEGAVVTVFTPDAAGEVFLDAADEVALLEAVAEAERGETISPEELFARMDNRAKQ